MLRLNDPTRIKPVPVRRFDVPSEVDEPKPTAKKATRNRAAKKAAKKAASPSLSNQGDQSAADNDGQSADTTKEN